MTRTVQERFPRFIVILTTATPIAAAAAAVAHIAATAGHLIASGEDEYRFRLRRIHAVLPFSPTIQARIAASVAGTNIHVSVPAARFWSILQIALFTIVLGGWMLSWHWSEQLAAPWIAAAMLLVSMSVVHGAGNRTIQLLENALSDAE
ncbi:MAG TPA: hypothetical protein VJ901_12345 [Thermoanaerobaculia bacterium]|nr:hypothetical protein [Thermoanaerobaculia bacterium]